MDKADAIELCAVLSQKLTPLDLLRSNNLRDYRDALTRAVELLSAK
jgi:ubiquinone biosynthesis protein Coq4